MNYTKMSDCCRLTSKLNQLSEIVGKSLFTSIKGLKGTIRSLNKPNDVNDSLIANSKYVLIDIIMQNIKSDSRIYIMAHIGRDTDCDKAMDSMDFAIKFKNIVGMILKEENAKRKMENAPGTILGELKNELDEETKIEFLDQCIPLKSRADKLTETISINKNTKTIDLSEDFKEIDKLHFIKAKELIKKTSKPKRNIDCKSIMLPKGRLALETIVQHDSKAFKTGKSLISTSLLAVSHVFRSMLGNTNESLSTACLHCRNKKQNKIYPLPDFNKCIENYYEEINKNIYKKQNKTCLKSPKSNSKQVFKDNDVKLETLKTSTKDLKYPPVKFNNYVEESKYIFDSSNGSVLKKCVSIISNLNKRKEESVVFDPGTLISPTPDRIPQQFNQNEITQPPFMNLNVAISTIKCENTMSEENGI